ncbi:MAG TPA: DUF1858 domain-containing protein [Pyrinomonadaceae bacterium]|nr:DUF1858 domain-containing protein [Pyrinomonadaceae bacterium]
MTSTNQPETISAQALLPDVIERYPATRAVFDRYGLQGCGGPLGPNETVSWFARLHGVGLKDLLGELNKAATNPVSAAAPFSPSRADTIFRPFFISGIVTVLTLGCLWGAINLLMIGLRQNFTSANYSWVLAHAHAMVFGFVGFFIMGFAYQAFPRFKHTSLWRPKLAFVSLPLMIAGIALQTVAHLIVPSRMAMPLELIAASVQLLAVVIFALVIVQTALRAKKPENYDRFVYAALGWFLLAAIINPIIFSLFEFPGTPQQLLFNLATFNIPYRDVQLLGIAVVLILGVSIRFLPHAYGLKEPSRQWQNFMFWGANCAIFYGALSFIAAMAGGNRWLLAVQWLTAIVLLIIAVGVPRQYRLFGPVPETERDRSLKFIRAAHVWFIVAMAMLVLTPIYNFAVYMPLTGSRVPFSHAFFGAYRHALTVGFVMMMIVGVSSKVVPILSGVDVRRAPSLWPAFLLLNLGNLTRVSTQIATDFNPSAYYVMGMSGFVEVVGLALWGGELIRNMRVGVKLERGEPQLPVKQSPLVIAPQSCVADVINAYPQSLNVFLKHGFTPLSNPVLRKTMARVVTVEQACRREGVDLEALLGELHLVSQRDIPVPLTRDQ